MSKLLTPAIKAEMPAVAEKDTVQPVLPHIIAKTTLYYVTSDETIPIELELDRNTDLVIETIVNEQLFKTEDFEIDQIRFILTIIQILVIIIICWQTMPTIIHWKIYTLSESVLFNIMVTV